MATTVVFGDEELSTIGMKYLEMHRSALWRPERMLTNLLANKTDQEGGERLVIPYEVSEHSSTTQMASGYEPVDLTVGPINASGTQTWFYAVRPIVLSTRDDIVGRGRTKITDRLQDRIKNVYNGFVQELNTHICRGTSTVVTDLLHLNGFDYTTGMIESDAVASQTNTVHGIAKSTYATLPTFQNQVYDGAGSFGSNGLKGMYDIMIRVKDVAMEPEKCKWYMSLNGQNHIKAALNSNEQYVSERELDGGKMVATFGGYPIESEPRLPNAGTTGDTTVDDQWTALFLDHAGIGLVGQSGWVLEMDEFRPLSGHIARVAFLHCFMQLVVRDYRTTGILWDAETF